MIWGSFAVQQCDRRSVPRAVTRAGAARLLGVHANTMTRLLAQLREEDDLNGAD